MKKIYIFTWGVLAAVLIFFWFYFPTLSHYRDLKVQQEEIEREIKGLEIKIQALAEERDLLKNDSEYLEKVIRDELGLVRPGEVIYKFVPDETSTVPNLNSESQQASSNLNNT